MNNTMETAIFGGGCFWCGEAVFQQLKGVEKVTSGYAGGSVENPSYQQVGGGKTGHVESIRIEYDPAVISYGTLLSVFFSTHDPTTLNRQGNDVGLEYRSVIFYMTEEQKQEASSYIKHLEDEKTFEQPIVTAVEAFTNFYEAEDYHHNYYKKNKEAPYCLAVIDPKIQKLREEYAHLLR